MCHVRKWTNTKRPSVKQEIRKERTNSQCGRIFRRIPASKIRISGPRFARHAGSVPVTMAVLREIFKKRMEAPEGRERRSVEEMTWERTRAT